MDRRLGHRHKLLLGLVIACMALSGFAPAFAQSANSLGGSWQPGPGATGANTYIGRVETPRSGSTVNAGTSLLVSGWAADTTAQGWSGFDQVQVFSGVAGAGGTKLADGQVGLSRPDVAQSLGSAFANSGFSATIPSSALSAGSLTLNVYLHTPSKGWWGQSLSVNVTAPVQLAFPSDPINVITEPSGGKTLTRQQFLNRFVFVGYALDRNPVITPNPYGSAAMDTAQFGPDVVGPGQSGIAGVSLWLDGLPGQPGAISIGNAYEGIQVGVNNQGPHPGPIAAYGSYPNLVRTYGPQYEFAGWVGTYNFMQLPTETWHTVYSVAVSSVTGKSSVASSTFYLKNATPGQTCSAFSDYVLHKPCSILSD